jgi:septum formation protein
MEGLGAQLFSEVSGDSFAIRGLPLIPVLNALRDMGVLLR